MLPKEKTKPRKSLQDLTMLIYGPSKIGKSTWCSQAEDVLFLATEPGLNSLEVYQQPITAWNELLKVYEEIARGNHRFRTIVIDTIDNAYKLCSAYICAKHNIKHESDLGYGKGFALVNNEFQHMLNKFVSLPYGLILVSHSQEKEIETRNSKITKMVTTLPDKASKIVTGLVDIILFCGFKEQIDKEGKVSYQRVMRTKPTRYYDAGDRTGRLSKVIPLDFAEFKKELEK